MNSVFNTAAKIEISAIILAINNDIGKIVEQHLFPHFEDMLREKHNMKLIETVLRQMPDFKRLEQENEALRREIETKSVQEPVSVPDAQALEHHCLPTTLLLCPFHNSITPGGPAVQDPVKQEPEPATLVPATPAQENIIKLEIVEKVQESENVISEKDMYSDVNLTIPLNNTQVKTTASEAEEAEASEAEASEAEEEASEAEASEAEASEAEASEAEEAEEEAEEAEAEEAEAEEAEEEEAEASEADASEAEEEEDASEAEEEAEAEASEAEEEEAEASEAEEEAEEAEAEASEVASEAEASEAEASEAEEEEAASEAADTNTEAQPGVLGGDPLEEEVFIIEIKGRGKFYTNNIVNGDIYGIEGEDDVGEQVGKFTNNVAKFF
jgi:hypothetical protein